MKKGVGSMGIMRVMGATRQKKASLLPISDREQRSRPHSPHKQSLPATAPQLPPPHFLPLPDRADCANPSNPVLPARPPIKEKSRLNFAVSDILLNLALCNASRDTILPCDIVNPRKQNRYKG